MNQTQNEVAAVAAVRPMVSALTLAYGASVTNAQLSFAVSMAFDCLPSLVNEDKTFTFTKYVDMVEAASGHMISKKTIQNNMSLSRRLLDTHRVKMATFGADETGISGFIDWVKDTLAPTTYTLKRDDLIAWCKGDASEADQRAKKAADDAAARAALAKQEAEKAAAPVVVAPVVTPTPVPLADVVAEQEAEAEAEAAAAAEAANVKAEQEARQAKQAEADKAAALAVQQQREALELAQAAAEEARKQAESFAVRVGVMADGSPDIVVALNPNPDFLEAVAAQLLAMSASIRAARSTAMGQAMTNAKPARKNRAQKAA